MGHGDKDARSHFTATLSVECFSYGTTTPPVSSRSDSTALATRTTKTGSPPSTARCGGTSATARSAGWSGGRKRSCSFGSPASGVILFDIGVALKRLAASAFDVPQECRPKVEEAAAGIVLEMRLRSRVLFLLQSWLL
ncbi:hypothetical protein ZIOFF_055451 [Zingiber officinale]|uniref:Uncharacterized protein n=1 Tax=Zingiber officinale TaxID=94328 RepID=A0A8J5FGG4_ZINOF|nr:hypothetical protein ZIOFF_055451 [Zingiber officinale]